MAIKDWRKTGSVTVEGGKWKAYAYRLQLNGTTKRVSKRVASEADGWDWIQLIRDENEVVEPQLSKSNKKNPPLTIRQLIFDYTEHRFEQQATTGKPLIDTLEKEQSTLFMRVVPEIGEVRLASSDLTDELSAFQRKLNTVKSAKTGKKLSESRKRKVMLALKSALEWGVKNGFLDAKKIKDVTVHSQKASNPREMVVPRADTRKLIQYLKEQGCDHENNVCSLRWLIALHTGRRSGEVLGLSWSDVQLNLSNPERSFFTVSNHLKSRPWIHGCGDGIPNKQGELVYPCAKQSRYCPQKHGGGLYLADGTKGGSELKPSIPIDGILFEHFIRHQTISMQERVKALEDNTADSSAKQFHNLVFLQPVTLRPYGARHDTNIWEKILVSAGIEERYTPHQLRHTAGTNLMEIGKSITEVKEILGHKSIQTTSKYIKHDTEALRPSLDAFASLLHGDDDTEEEA